MTKIKSKRVEVVEPNGFRCSGIKRELGDIFTSKKGQYYIDLGWAKCTETDECGDRIEGSSRINPQDYKEAQKS